MYNLVWQSVMCRPGKLLILLVTKNQMLRPTAPTARPTSVPWGKRAAGDSLTTTVGYALPPSAYPRRILILIVADLGGRRANDAKAKAQEVMYEAWNQTSPRARVALAHKALAISPLCADAYVLLAEEEAEIGRGGVGVLSQGRRGGKAGARVQRI